MVSWFHDLPKELILCRHKSIWHLSFCINKFPQTLNRNSSSFVHRLLCTKIRRKTSSLLATRLCLVILMIFLKVFVQEIFMKFSGLVDNLKTNFFLFWWRHFRFWKLANVQNFRGCRSPDFFLQNYKSYQAEIFLAGRQGVIVLMVSFSIFSPQRRRSSPGPENRQKMSTTFLHILIYYLLYLNISKHI